VAKLWKKIVCILLNGKLKYLLYTHKEYATCGPMVSLLIYHTVLNILLFWVCALFVIWFLKISHQPHFFVNLILPLLSKEFYIKINFTVVILMFLKSPVFESKFMFKLKKNWLWSIGIHLSKRGCFCFKYSHST